MRNFTPINFESTESGPSLSEEIYNVLRRDLEGSKHGSRFSLRDIYLSNDPEITSAFDVDQPYLPPRDVCEEHRDVIAELASGLVMRQKDWEALVEAFKTVYKIDEVKRHRASGGIVKFVDSHRTYVGQVIEQIASREALKLLEVDAPHEIQTTIISRVTTLFRLPLLQQVIEKTAIPHHTGAIVDDLLLLYGGALLTIPNTQSGSRLVQAIKNGKEARRAIVDRTKLAYEQIINRGGEDGQIIFEGSSGAENEYNSEKDMMIIGEVKPRTIEMTTAYNQTENAERVIVVPIFMESDPFTKNPKNPIESRPTPFAFLAPRFLKNERDFHYMMAELAVAGTRFKKSGEPEYDYPQRVLSRRQKPEYIYTHSV